MLLGVNFSHRHAAWLGLEPEALYRRLLDELGVRRVRLSVYWDEVAPTAERLDFAPLRRWLDPLEARGGAALLTLGLKAQRWPEFYPPAWLTDANPLPKGAHLEQQPRLVTHLLLLLERLTAFLADYGSIEAWQVENEPFLPGMRRTVGWQFSPTLLAREMAVVRESDPRRRPIVLNHSSQSRFDRRGDALRALQAGEPRMIYAENVYTRKPNHLPWPRYFNPYAVPFLKPELGVHALPLLKPELFRRPGLMDGPLWITELQAEPWERADLRALTPALIGSISPARIEANLRLVERAGAQQIYLWGAEWWRYTADRHGDERYWHLARRLFRNG